MVKNMQTQSPEIVFHVNKFSILLNQIITIINKLITSDVTIHPLNNETINIIDTITENIRKLKPAIEAYANYSYKIMATSERIKQTTFKDGELTGAANESNILAMDSITQKAIDDFNMKNKESYSKIMSSLEKMMTNLLILFKLPIIGHKDALTIMHLADTLLQRNTYSQNIYGQAMPHQKE